MAAQALGRAPGGDAVFRWSPLASPEGIRQGLESIRELVLKGSVDRWSPVYRDAPNPYAARRDHVERVIRPARWPTAAWVVCAIASPIRPGPIRAALPEEVDPILIAAMETHVLEANPAGPGP